MPLLLGVRHPVWPEGTAAASAFQTGQRGHRGASLLPEVAQRPSRGSGPLGWRDASFPCASLLTSAGATGTQSSRDHTVRVWKADGPRRLELVFLSSGVNWGSGDRNLVHPKYRRAVALLCFSPLF